MMQTDAPVSPSLASALETLRARGLEMRRGSEAPPLEHARPSVPTGQPALDVALGTGGWPRGALALLDAPAGSGATTLALGSLAAAQAAGGLTAWLDLDGTLDPAVAARLGVSLEWLLVARPHDAAEAIELAAWLGRSGPHRRAGPRPRRTGDARSPRRWIGSARCSPVRGAHFGARARAGRPSRGRRRGRGAGGAASVRLAGVGRDLVGQRVRALVERHRWALAGASAELDLWFGEGRRIDPLVAALPEPRRSRRSGPRSGW